MKRQNAAALLKERIREQENKCDTESFYLEEQFHSVIETLKPANLVSDMLHSTGLKGKLLDGVIGLSAGFIAGKVVVHYSKNSLIKLLGTIAGMGIAGFVPGYPAGIKPARKKLPGLVSTTKKRAEQV